MKPKAIIIDLDGTLSNSSKRVHLVSENPKDYIEFYKHIPEDEPNEWCVNIVKTYYYSEIIVIFLTGRPEEYRGLSRDWLLKYVGFSAPLIMRKDGDYRPDYDYKREKIKELKEHFDIIFAIDDRKGPWKAFKDEGIVCLFCGEVE